ncbi:DUF2642 domain-containing protein [Cohnella endophytica]|nr:DUF2642 domain-containing protein [Cohnella endophytica]
MIMATISCTDRINFQLHLQKHVPHTHVCRQPPSHSLGNCIQWVQTYSKELLFLYHPSQISPSQMSPNQILTVSNVDPYVVEALRRLIGRCVLLETTRGAIEGTIVDVKPDHVLLQLHSRQACVRIAEIVWTMPL